MKKKIVLVIAVALVMVTSLAMLIGCTPSKPDKYMQKWIDSKEKSITTISDDIDYVAEVDKKTGEIKQVKGKTTVETSIIINENVKMMKMIEISTKIVEKTGKEAKTSTIKPTGSKIFEWDSKANKYNVYTYALKIEQKEVAGGNKEYSQVGEWTATQMSKEDAEKDITFMVIKESETSYTEQCKAVIKDFDKNFKKNKSGQYEGTVSIDIPTITPDGQGSTTVEWNMKLKVKDSDLQFEIKMGDETQKGRANYKDKITISSGAKTALDKFLNPDKYKK